ncbi:30645_t:CDS:2 [Racocetra persica]|uniref:30645_t:CDS:1 n=1 Tax=Racocetra persica TaxID=160502 RepID=A0ACA9NU19_9GLOM|nr:30645_t:CDS:2 [Racocetra persica]
MGNNIHEAVREEIIIHEADEKNMQLNAKYTKIVFAQQSSSETSNTINSILLAFLSGLVGSILLKRVFLTNTRTDRTSSIDYFLSSQEVKDRIIEMFAFEAHDYSHEFILKDVNKHLPLNSRQI